MANQKIKNASKVVTEDITFKSKLEKSTYETLLSLGYNPQYEPTTFTLWPGFTPITPFYDKETETQKKKRDPKNKTFKQLVLKTSPVIGIRYTPDFYFRYNDLDVFIETKGIENDVHYIKKKLFRKYLDDVLESTGQKSIYFEVYTKKQLLQALEIIKEYDKKDLEVTT